MLYTYQIYTTVAIAVALVIATYYDCKSGVIPIFLFPVLPAVILPLAVVSGQMDIVYSFIGLLIGALTFWSLAFFFDGGGGDILMMSALGWCLGIRGIIILILASSVIYAVFATIVIGIYAIKKRAKEALEKQYPFAPFVLAGFLVCLLFGWLF